VTTTPADLSLPEPFSDNHVEHSVVVDLQPSTKIIKDLKRVPKELRPTISVVADSRWDLTPLVQKKTLASAPLLINFDSFPAAYRATAKRLIWCYINVATPVADLERATATRAQLSPTSISASANQLKNWMKRLTEKNILQFSDVADNDFDDYCEELSEAGLDRSVIGYRLFAVTRAWLYAPYLPEDDRLARPTWERGPDGRSDVLGPANWSSENKTAPIHPQTMSALLVWSLRFVENFSADIIAAKAMKSIPSQVDSQLAELSHYGRFRQYFNRRREGSKTAPGTMLTKYPGMRGFARLFIAWELGIGADDLGRMPLTDSLTRGLTPTEDANLPLVVTGTVDGQTKWIDAIDFYKVEDLCRHLATAAFIVTAYLTGIRGEECRALEQGCCQPTKNAATGQAHYLIHGKTFKNALDKSGNAIPSGADREQPWLAIAPVAKAVAVMEALQPESALLFPIEAFTGLSALSPAGTAVHTAMIGDRIAKLIHWCNETAHRLGRPDEMIPPDPDGSVAVKRFRRTLAWFIYRKPGGRIALGVQYGHLRGHTTDGYGSRVATGLRDVFPMEEALARAEYLEDAYAHLKDGEHVSGPASGRYTEALRLYGQEFHGRYLSSKQAAALRSNPRLRIYDNATRFVTCCYDQSKALCHPDRLGPAGTEETPDINHCQPNCGNIARTDRNIGQIVDAITRHESEMASPMTPEPLRARLAQRVATLRAIIETHDGEGKTDQ
jgi:hypothetical protein